MTVSRDMTLFETVEKWTLSRSGRSGDSFLQLGDVQNFAEKSIRIHFCESKNYFPAPTVFDYIRYKKNESQNGFRKVVEKNIDVLIPPKRYAM